MGMARVETYPVPRIRKVRGMWRVTWCDMYNQVWYMEFFTWERAMGYLGLTRGVW